MGPGFRELPVWVACILKKRSSYYIKLPKRRPNVEEGGSQKTGL